MADRDVYTCQASNAAGSDVRSTKLHIKHAPIMVSHTTDVLRSWHNARMNLTCTCDAVPAPDWTWWGPEGGRIEFDGVKFVELSADPKT